MKYILFPIILFGCALGFTQAQLNMGLNVGPKAGFAGLSPGQFFQNIVLQSEAEKLLVNPDLTDDLRQRVLDTMTSAELGFNNCSTVGIMPWMQIRCSALQLQRSKNELKMIENEMTARSLAAANAAPVNAGAPTSSN